MGSSRTTQSDFSDKLHFDPEQLSASERYRLLIGSIVPRPIAFISSVSPGGQTNLAPFSFFNGVSSDPPCVSVSIAFKPDGQKKDTLRNIEDTGEFVVNGASQFLADAVVQSAAEYPYGESEIDVTGLSVAAGTIVSAPRLNEAPYSFECRLHSSVLIGTPGPGASTLVVAEIVFFHFAKDIYRDGGIDLWQLDPLARLGGSDYGSVTTSFSKRPPKL
jgi:flavin reductase (DIM6/NTAB) family NADH-FMN oxidoreductase RutF